jgi:hypothetical protein
MLSVASLLNPEMTEPRISRTTSSFTPLAFSRSSSYDQPSIGSIVTSNRRPKMTKDGAVFTKGKIVGDVNYPPFDSLDEEITHEIRKFRVYPLGKIQMYPRHIPYNSEKKTFLEKTGRESFEGIFEHDFLFCVC